MAIVCRSIKIRQIKIFDLLCSNFSTKKWSPKALVLYHDKSLEAVKVTVNDVIKWYEDFAGVRVLREAHERADAAAEAMEKAQEMRRFARQTLDDAQKKLQEFQFELRNISREDDRYIYLIKEEHSLLKDSKRLQEHLNEMEGIEREAFEKMMTALRRSHETERIQASVAKYASIFATILGTIIGIIGTTINNNIKLREMKKSIEDAMNEEKMVRQIQQSINEKLDSFINNNHKSSTNEEKIVKPIQKSISDKLDHLMIRHQNMEKVLIENVRNPTEISDPKIGTFVFIISAAYIVSKLFGF